MIFKRNPIGNSGRKVKDGQNVQSLVSIPVKGVEPERTKLNFSVINSQNDNRYTNQLY